MADTWFVLLDLLALEARPLESFVIEVVLSLCMFGGFDLLVRVSPCTAPAFLGTILGQLYTLLDG